MTSTPQSELTPTNPSRRALLALLAALTLLFAGVGASTVYRAAFGEKERSDFTVYQAAGQAVLDGTNIYDARNVRGWYFTALPVFAAASVPFALMSKAVGAGVWYVLCLASLLHATWLTAGIAQRTLGPDGGGQAGRLRIALLALTLTAWPWLSGLTRGQVSVPLAWMAIVAVHIFLRERRRVMPLLGGGVALAGAIIVKVFPALLIGWLLLRRKWAATLATFVALAVVLFPLPALVFGWSENLQLLERWVTTIAMPLGDAQQEAHARYRQMLDPRIDKNQSLQAVAIRVLAPSEEAGQQDLRETIARGLALVVGLGLLVTTTIACLLSTRRVGRHGPRAYAVDARQASAFVLLSLFLAPLTWSHYYTVALLPVALASATVLAAGAEAVWSRRYGWALGIWLVGFLGSIAEPIYELGGHLIAGLAVWTVTVWHLFATEAVDSIDHEATKNGDGPASPQYAA